MEYHKDDSTLQRLNAGKCDGFVSHTQALLTKRRSRAKLKVGYNHTKISKSWNFYYRLVNQVQTRNALSEKTKSSSRGKDETLDIILEPVLTLKNLMPQPMMYKLCDELGVELACGVVSEASSIAIHSIERTEDVTLSVYLANYRWSNPFNIFRKTKKRNFPTTNLSQAKKEFDIPLEGLGFIDSVDNGEKYEVPDLILRCMRQIDSVAVYCPFLLENCSHKSLKISPSTSFTKKLKLQFLESI